MHPSKPTIYFGYGSNLWRQQMRQRCPTSQFLGLARLRGYKWIIYERGYANIVQLDDDHDGDDDDEDSLSPPPKNSAQHDYTKEVWGAVYALLPADERRLDGNEGVPVAYRKESIACEFWAEGADVARDKPKNVEMLVYINRDVTAVGKVKEEYVYRMNRGIRDAVKEGVPGGYVRDVLREWIPEGDDDDNDDDDEGEGIKETEGVREKAWRQAVEFKEER